MQPRNHFSGSTFQIKTLTLRRAGRKECTHGRKKWKHWCAGVCKRKKHKSDFPALTAQPLQPQLGLLLLAPSALNPYRCRAMSGAHQEPRGLRMRSQLRPSSLESLRTTLMLLRRGYSLRTSAFTLHPATSSQTWIRASVSSSTLYDGKWW